MANQTVKIWATGPKELLEHAFDHLAKGQPFDFRIAMISVDNAVELTIKTYLSLPKRVRGNEGPSLKRFEDCSTSFPSLLNLLEEFAKSKITGIDLGDIEIYHRTRNTLYHDGNGITVDPNYVDGYLQIARVLLNNLLGVSIEKDKVNPPTSSVGDLVLKWAILVDKINTVQNKFIDEPVPINEPVLHIVDRLISKNVLDSLFRERLRYANAYRNKLVHSASISLSEENVSKVLTVLNELIQELNEKYIFHFKVD